MHAQFEIRCHARFRQGDPDQAIARNNLGQLVFRPALGASRTNRHDDEAALLVRVFDTNINLRRQRQAELGQHLARPANQTATIVRRAIPLRLEAENGARIAGAQGANNNVMHAGRVFEDAQIGVIARRAKSRRIEVIDADRLAGSNRIGHHQLLVLGIEPGFGNHACRRRGADVLGELGEFAVIFGGEQAFLDANFAYRNFECLEVADFIHQRGRSVVIVIV